MTNIKRLKGGDIWAWCTIQVKGVFGALSATETLGCCSYKSREDFIEANDYYQDMRNEVLKQLQGQLDDLLFRLPK